MLKCYVYAKISNTVSLVFKSCWSLRKLAKTGQWKNIKNVNTIHKDKKNFNTIQSCKLQFWNKFRLKSALRFVATDKVPSYYERIVSPIWESLHPSEFHHSGLWNIKTTLPHSSVFLNTRTEGSRALDTWHVLKWIRADKKHTNRFNDWVQEWSVENSGFCGDYEVFICGMNFWREFFGRVYCWCFWYFRIKSIKRV